MTRKQIVTRFHLFLLVVLGAITITAYVKIPAASGLPVHWGFDGHPDQIWPRDTALLCLPALGIFLTAIVAAIGQFAPVEQIEPGRYISDAMLTGMLGLFCALQFALILIGVGSDIDVVRIISFALSAILIVCGALLPAAPFDAYAGLRLPWTLRHPGHWTISHRFTGILLILCGLGLGTVAWLRPDATDLFFAMAAALLIPVVIGGLFSFIRSRF